MRYIIRFCAYGSLIAAIALYSIWNYMSATRPVNMSEQLPIIATSSLLTVVSIVASFWVIVTEKGSGRFFAGICLLLAIIMASFLTVPLAFSLNT